MPPRPGGPVIHRFVGVKKAPKNGRLVLLRRAFAASPALSLTLRSIAQAMRLEGSRPLSGLHHSPSNATGSRECAPPTSASARAEMTGSTRPGDGAPY
jgi:hypothetical protein